MVEEADEFLRVRKVGTLIDTAGDVADVDAREGVDGAGVAADGEGAGDDGGHLHEVGGEDGGAVVVEGAEGAAVPGVGLDNVLDFEGCDGTSYLGCVHSRGCM